MPNDPYREACRRQHRVLGHFLAVQAWLRGVDCIILRRGDLEAFLWLERFKQQRLDWMRRDLRPWFPYSVSLSASTAAFSSVVLSRRDLPDVLFRSPRTDMEHADALTRAGIVAQVFRDDDGLRSLQERDVVRYLAVLDSGLDEPRVLQGMARESSDVWIRIAETDTHGTVHYAACDLCLHGTREVADLDPSDVWWGPETDVQAALVFAHSHDFRVVRCRMCVAEDEWDSGERYLRDLYG